MKSAQVFEYLTHASDYGITISGEVKPDFSAMISRSRSVANGMSKGVQFLFKKNNIDHLKGSGRLAGNNSVEVKIVTAIKKAILQKILFLLPEPDQRSFPILSRMGKR